MANTTPATAGNKDQESGLVKARRSIKAARERGTTFDGGSTGRTDGND